MKLLHIKTLDFNIISFEKVQKGRLGLENGSERSKINTAKMASILIENVKKCTRIMEIIMFMITN